MAAAEPGDKSCLVDDDICAEVLTNIIVIVERIFKYLNARQLNTCARVCKVWYNQAKREKESRDGMRWNCFSADHWEPGDFDAQSWWSSISSYILEGPVEPAFALLFCSEALFCHLTEVKHKNGKKNKQGIETLLMAVLPAQCRFEVVVADGIIGTDSKMKTEELEAYELALSLVLFSKTVKQQVDLNFEFVPFSFTHKECQALAKYWSEGTRSTPAFMRPVLNKEVCMVNLFCPMNGIDQEIGYSFLRMFNCPLIAGGCVNSKILRDYSENNSSCETKPFLAGFYVCGKNVKVASVLIKSNVDTEEEVDKVILSLKKHNFSEQLSFGLMYACLGRGVHVYDRRNVESGAFRKHFPSTPLLGFFGNGEVGYSYPSPALRTLCSSDGRNDSGSSSNNGENERTSETNETEGRRLRSGSRQSSPDKSATKMKHPPKLLHAYTTVMCLVSLS